MLEHIAIPMIVGLIMLFIVCTFVFAWCSKHNSFIKNAKSIQKGMSKNMVLTIMGTPTTVQNNDELEILTWEKNQWKGIQNGGTLTRSIQVTFENNRVIQIVTKNLDVSTFW